MFQFYDSMIQGMYLIRFETWTEYDLLVSESYFWFAQTKRCNTQSPPSWLIDSLKIINWVWSTRFEILFPIRSNKTVNQNHDFESWPRGYKTFSSCSTQLSMKFFLLINVKMPTIVGTLTFMSRKNSILGLSASEKSWISWYFILMSI